MKLKLTYHEATELVYYFNQAICNPVKSNEAIKEYVFAKHIEKLMFKTEIVLLKYKQDLRKIGYKKIKTILITELDCLILNVYFSRYKLTSFLIPIEQQVMEGIRINYPHLVNVIKNKIQWNEFITK